MLGQHYRLNGHEFEQTLGDGRGQRSLVCCRPWGCKELDTIYRLNNNNSLDTSYCNKIDKQQKPTV